jgi:hypothetical protein
MDSYQACSGGLEEMMQALQAAGLDEVSYRSPLGSLVLRGNGIAEETPDAGEEDGSGSTRLVLLRSTCVGRWGRSLEAGAAHTVDKDARLGSLATLLGEEKVQAPGRGWVEKWIIEEGEVAGFGDPLALWREVG